MLNRDLSETSDNKVELVFNIRKLNPFHKNQFSLEQKQPSP